ncbi:MAG: helix-turn-helix transcriptional regulator [Clostridia bacterium]|nr:helix-turn-helix transcriptional regulator [Clostridia bacterium]
MDYAYEKLLGKHISNIRKSQNMTQDELSTKLQLEGCDITRSALAKIESGQRRIYASEIKALSSVLSISYDELLI